MMHSSYRLLEALGLGGGVDVAALVERRLGYACRHVGLSELRIGELIDVLADERGSSRLCPPRTGHLGNWQAIASGRAGALDFNQTICLGGFGYPLIYCFTQTEAEPTEAQPGAGDWAYVPGSVVEHGALRPLPLQTWNGTEFVRRDRTTPLFCPFVRTLDESTGAPIGLTELHRRRMEQIPGFKFKIEAEIIVSREDEVREILRVLLKAADRSTNPRRALQDLISHAAAPDGSVRRCELWRDGRGYVLDGTTYADTETLLDHILVPFRAVTDSETFFSGIRGLPHRIPVMSNLLVSVLSALFTTHLPEADPSHRRVVTQPFNAHLHWGARDMAGFPPRRRGYVLERSTARSLRAMCGALLEALPSFDPICMVMLPAAVFMLCPSTAHPDDQGLLDELFGAVVAVDADVVTTERLTAEWLERRGSLLSPYLVNRFRRGSGVPASTERQQPGRSLVIERFRALSFRQACAVVGVITDAVSSRVPPCD